MALEKVTNDRYLDGYNLSFLHESTALAYLIDARVGWSERSQSAFYVFYFRDVNGHMIVGRMFNISPEKQSGYDLARMKRRPVLIRYRAQAFQGVSLILESLDLYDQGDFDFSRFNSAIPDAKALLDNANMIVGIHTGKNVTFNPVFETESYIEFCDGRSGGYAKFISMVVESARVFEDAPGVVPEDFYDCLVLCLYLYEKYVSLRAAVEVPVPAELFNMVHEETRHLQGVKGNIALDCAMAVLEMGKPQHPYSHIIYDLITRTRKLLSYTYSTLNMARGTVKSTDGVVVSKY